MIERKQLHIVGAGSVAPPSVAGERCQSQNLQASVIGREKRVEGGRVTVQATW
jgi:hypothetical protein